MPCFETLPQNQHLWKHNLNPKEKSMTSLNSSAKVTQNAFQKTYISSPKKLQNIDMRFSRTRILNPENVIANEKIERRRNKTQLASYDFAK